jgi:hypothetical protein
MGVKWGAPNRSAGDKGRKEGSWQRKVSKREQSNEINSTKKSLLYQHMYAIDAHNEWIRDLI